MIGRQQQVLHANPQIRIEFLARYEDQTRDVAVEAVASHEEPRALTLLQPQNAHGDVGELIDVDLEQLVARVLFEDRDERLGQMAVRQESGAADDRRHLAAHQRNFVGRHHVDGGRVEAEEAPLAAHVPLRVEALDAHVVEIAGTVHARARVRLRQEDRCARLHDADRAGREPRDVGRAGVSPRLAQHAQARARHALQIVAVVALDQFVVAITEEGEVTREHPVEKRLRFVDFLALLRRDTLLFCALRKRFDGRMRGGLHPPPVFDGRTDVAEHAL